MREAISGRRSSVEVPDEGGNQGGHQRPSVEVPDEGGNQGGHQVEVPRNEEFGVPTRRLGFVSAGRVSFGFRYRIGSGFVWVSLEWVGFRSGFVWSVVG